jgi:ABC-type branched-subunit amino acid transport system ATPase component
MALLETKGLSKHFGGLRVTNEVDLVLEHRPPACRRMRRMRPAR